MGMRTVVSALDDAVASGALARLCERHGVEVLTLFGSAVTRPSTARDLDLAVRFRRKVIGDPLSLLDGLMELLGTDSIDVLDLGRASPTARFSALLTPRPLYEAHDGAWATAQMAAAVEFYETTWLRRMDLEQLAG